MSAPARGLALLLVALVLSLRALAYASPPDPTWIDGFYDDADYDDVVILITATPGTPPATLVRGVDPHWTPVWLVVEAFDAPAPSGAPPQRPSRGPPRP